MHEEAEHDSRQRQNGSVQLDGSFDIPFFIELAQATGKCAGRADDPMKTLSNVLVDPIVDLIRGMSRNAIVSGRQYHCDLARALG